MMSDEQINEMLNKADQLLVAQEVKYGISDTLLWTDEDDKLSFPQAHFHSGWCIGKTNLCKSYKN